MHFNVLFLEYYLYFLGESSRKVQDQLIFVYTSNKIFYKYLIKITLYELYTPIHTHSHFLRTKKNINDLTDSYLHYRRIFATAGHIL